MKEGGSQKKKKQLAEDPGITRGRRRGSLRERAEEGEEEGKWRNKKRLVHKFFLKIQRGYF